MCSGGYSNLGARGKNFQKLMLPKKKSFDFGLHIFLRNSWCPLKKRKKKDLHFHLLSDLFLSQNQSSKKKKTLNNFTNEYLLEKHRPSTLVNRHKVSRILLAYTNINS